MDHADDLLPAPPRQRDPAFPMALSLALHVGVLVVSALSMPPLGATDTDTTADWTFLRPLTAEPTREPQEPDEEDQPVQTWNAVDPDGAERSDSRCGEQHGGTMGRPTAAETGHHYGVRGPADNPDPHIATDGARPEGWDDVLSFERIPTPWPGAHDAPTAPWGRDDALGNDERNARGPLWGDDVGESFGSPGNGIGLRRLCPTCGASGRGFDHVRSQGGGATGTEPSPRPAPPCFSVTEGSRLHCADQ